MSFTCRHPVITDPFRGGLAAKLVAHGRPHAELEAVRQHSEGAKRAEWARALYAAELPARASRIAQCGTLRAAAVQATSTGLVTATGYAAERCRDRLCPRCAAMRAHELGHSLRSLIDHEREARRVDETELHFITLTQPKIPTESPGAALARVLCAWSRTTHRKYVAGKRIRGLVIGGVRAIELAWGDGITANKSGYVAERGWHVHIHAIVETRGPRGAWWIPLRDRWLAVTGGRAAAQHVQRLTEQRTGQLAKYPLKPFRLEDRSQVRAVALAVDGARLLQGWGTWKGWQGRAQQLRRAPAAKLRACGTALATVMLFLTGETRLETPPTITWKERDSSGAVRGRALIVDARAVLEGGYLRSGTPREQALDAYAESQTRVLERYEARLRRCLPREARPPPAPS